MLYSYGIYFWSPYRAGLDDAAKPASEYLLTYLKELAKQDPSFKGLELPGGGKWTDWDKPSPEFERLLQEKRYTLSFQLGADKPGFLSMSYNAGSIHFATEFSIAADDAFLVQSGAVAVLLDHGIQHLPVTEAGAVFVDDDGWHFWRRWIKSNRGESPVPDIPFEDGWASEEEHLGGTLYSWPTWEPARLIDAGRD